MSLQGDRDNRVTSSEMGQNSVGPPNSPLQLSSKLSLLSDLTKGRVRLPGAHSNQSINKICFANAPNFVL